MDETDVGALTKTIAPVLAEMASTSATLSVAAILGGGCCTSILSTQMVRS